MDSIKQEQQLGKQVSTVGFIANVFLAASKLTVGILANSQALISDSVNSIGDVLSTFVVFIGVRASRKAADQDHQFGHERLDSLAAIILSMFFLLTAIFIGYEGVMTILKGVSGSIPAPGNLAWITAVVAIAIKEGLYWYTILAAKKLRSTALKAAAWDHQTDVISTSGALIGIVGARLFNFPLLDPILSLVICLLILSESVTIFKEASSKLVDKSCDSKTEQTFRECILGVEGVMKIDVLRTRQFGERIFIDLEISVDKKLSLEKAHNIAENVHNKIEKQFPLVKHIMVHVNPYSEKQ